MPFFLAHMTQTCIIIYLQGADVPRDIYFIKGAVDRLLPMCSTFYHKGEVLPLTPKQTQGYVQQASRMGSAGLRGINQTMIITGTMIMTV